jgi:hypothetical protein
MTRPKADEHWDYRWRLAMRKKDWARIVYRLSIQIDYTNFKNAVHERPDQENKFGVLECLERDAAGAARRGKPTQAEPAAVFQRLGCSLGPGAGDYAERAL